METPRFGCSRCHGAKLEPGTLQAYIKVHFRPDNLKFLTLKAGVPVRVEVCVDCGHVQMTVDPRELAKLTNRWARDVV